MFFGVKDYFLMWKKRGLRLPIYYFLQTHLFDLIYRTDTHIWLPKESFVDKPKSFKNGVLYMSSWTSIIKKSTRKVFELFPLTPMDVALIDIGCGKGKVLCVWNKMFPRIYKIVGIDYSLELLRICKINLKKISAFNIEISCIDASNFALNLDCNFYVFYLYNPFDATILSKFLDRIKDKKAIIIYSNPVYSKILIDSNFKEYYREIGWHPNASFMIFSNIDDFYF